LEIVDAQVHVGPGGLESLIASMNALGISAALLDEFWGIGAGQPGYRLPNGVWRLTSPTVEVAQSLHPDRFAYLQRLDVEDPDVATTVRRLAESPGALAIRLTPGLKKAELQAFAEGRHRAVVAQAVEAGLAVFVMIQGHVELLAPYLEAFPSGRFIIDHCGMPLEFPLGPDGPPTDPGPDFAYFQTVLAMAKHPNVALKWSHAQGMFKETAFPFRGLDRFLLAALAAFGKERVIWASDASTSPGARWGDLLYCLRAHPGLSDEDKAWILGRALRTWIGWPAPS